MYDWYERRRRMRKAAGGSLTALSTGRTDYYSGLYSTTTTTTTTTTTNTDDEDLPIPRNCSSGVILMSDGRGGVKMPETDAKKIERTTDGRIIETESIRLTIPEMASRSYQTKAYAAEASNLSAKLNYDRPAPRFVPFQTGMDLLADALLPTKLPPIATEFIGDYMSIGFRVGAGRQSASDDLPWIQAVVRYFDMRDRPPAVTMVSLHAPPDDVEKPRPTFISLFSTPLCQDKTACFEVAEANSWIRVWFESLLISEDFCPTSVDVYLPFNPL